ncbi:transporter substrate-binding domain-containing protein, partial [Litorivivens sp.]|uniref:transporter substrate-binding domain-containing protein n=1 Tax=Litorivivens sp. TaxID=2020868 RepID=UPI0035620248
MKIPLLLLACGLLYGCAQDEGATTEDTTLKVVTRNAPTTYYFNQDQRVVGPEHDLVMAFAKDQGRTVSFVVVDTVADVLQVLEEGKADLAAAGLSITDERKSRFLFSQHYRSIQQQVVCRRGEKKARDVAGLTQINLAVSTESAYEYTLKTLKKTHPKLQWQSRDADSEQLLREVWEKQIDCTVADSHIVAVNRRYMPELLVMFDLQTEDTLVWAMPREATGLKRAADRFFNSEAGDRALQLVEHRYYSYIDNFDFVDT